ncbi:TetR/AcrR family transcriptional regulator [bacterium]|nr:TetR/AcrR family transcriptional regulator [bacterium]
MEKQRARTTEEKELRKIKLLSSAKKIFSEYGFQGTKITMITENAGLSPAAFYLYFKNKIEIYRILSIEGTELLTKMVEKALSIKVKKCAPRIKALAEAYFGFFQKERAYYDIITVHHLGQKDFFQNMNLVPQLEKQSLDLLKILAMIIEEGINSGEFKKLNAWKTAVTLWGMMDGVLLMEVRKTTGYIDLDIKSLTAQFQLLCLEALKK